MYFIIAEIFPNAKLGLGFKSLWKKSQIGFGYWVCAVLTYEKNSKDSETLLTGDYNPGGYNQIYTGKLSEERNP